VGETARIKEIRNSFLYAEGFVIGAKEVKNTIRYAIPRAKDLSANAVAESPRITDASLPD
jgi:hypothetical protein